MVRPAENSEKETLKNFPQENYWNPDEKERERAMFVYTIQATIKNRNWEKVNTSKSKKQKKKNQKIRTKILIPSYCAKIKVREQSVKLQMVDPPNMTTNESKSNPERAELGWIIVLEIEI